ncbi:tethering factor for nuclear proteasome Cut8 [Schizosaccharomyces osmophilus]|uniref:Tethering factor for nuclear proteasome STS1 n=1 Tax=Schizosaccharomyces osmophilus TaxID=2545709 RepID=A0AAF0AXI7_9SCHI|nr:tethering factor for nuclear proteasome Cut8 [Schizosaccharomyces osmophilus]WBW74163.1 tethering factor for nuclear proteasome Cut8 [Schizosaccharomyces osmophilus]
METLSYSYMKKRKADSDEPIVKKARQLPVGNQLPLPRLFQYTEKQQLVSLLLQCVEKHPDLGRDIREKLPVPSLETCIGTMQKLSETLHSSFPYGGDKRGEYAFNRIREKYMAVLHALNDLVPCYLPPHSTCFEYNFAFLDAATNVVHQLPEFHNPNHNVYKSQAYYELTGAWLVVLKQLEERPILPLLPIEELEEHNQKSHNRLQEAVVYLKELRENEPILRDRNAAIQQLQAPQNHLHYYGATNGMNVGNESGIGWLNTHQYI